MPGGSEGKASACNAGDLGSIPGSESFPGGGNGNPLQYSCLQNPMDRGAWRATVHGVAESRTRLSDFTHSLTLRPWSGLFRWDSTSIATNEQCHQRLLHLQVCNILAPTLAIAITVIAEPAPSCSFPHMKSSELDLPAFGPWSLRY